MTRPYLLRRILEVLRHTSVIVLWSHVGRTLMSSGHCSTTLAPTLATPATPLYSTWLTPHISFRSARASWRHGVRRRRTRWHMVSFAEAVESREASLLRLSHE